MAYRNPVNQFDIEEALDKGYLFVAMASGSWWKLRRNGATRKWKRTPDRFEIPCKMGFRGHVTLDHATPNDCLRIAANRNEAEEA
jgi:hypothetical protein